MSMSPILNSFTAQASSGPTTQSTAGTKANSNPLAFLKKALVGALLVTGGHARHLREASSGVDLDLINTASRRLTKFGGGGARSSGGFSSSRSSSGFSRSSSGSSSGRSRSNGGSLSAGKSRSSGVSRSNGLSSSKTGSASRSSYLGTYGIAAVAGHQLLHQDGSSSPSFNQDSSCATHQRYGEKFVLVPSDANLTSIKDNSTALQKLGVQIVDVVVVSDCAAKPGNRYTSSAIDATLDAFNSAGYQVAASEPYPAPCLPSRLAQRNHYKLADDDNWPLSRVGVRSENATLEQQLTQATKRELGENPEFQKAKNGCDRDAYIGTFIPFGGLALLALAIAATCCRPHQ